MKKNDPKIILNVQLTNEELEEKVKIAMDKYVDQLIWSKIDDTILKILDRRIENILHGSRWDQSSKINGVSFDQYVKDRTDKALTDIIDKNAKEILVKKLAALI